MQTFIDGIGDRKGNGGGSDSRRAEEQTFFRGARTPGKIPLSVGSIHVFHAQTPDPGTFRRITRGGQHDPRPCESPVIIIVRVAVKSAHDDLPDLRQTLRILRRLACSLQGGKKHPRKRCDDRNHDQELHQCKTPPLTPARPFPVLSHGMPPCAS